MDPPGGGGTPPKSDSWGPNGVDFYPHECPLDLLQGVPFEGGSAPDPKNGVFGPPRTSFWTPPEGGGTPPRRGGSPPRGGGGYPPLEGGPDPPKSDSWGPAGVRFYPLSMPLDLLQTPLFEGGPPENRFFGRFFTFFRVLARHFEWFLGFWGVFWQRAPPRGGYPPSRGGRPLRGGSRNRQNRGPATSRGGTVIYRVDPLRCNTFWSQRPIRHIFGPPGPQLFFFFMVFDQNRGRKPLFFVWA